MTITSTISPALKFGLQFLGFWPGVSYSTIYWSSFMSSMLIVQYFQYLYVFDHLKMSELSNLVDSLVVTLDYSLSFLKLASLWLHRRVLHKILADMDNDWRECINIEQHLYLMTIKANISHFFSNALLSFNVIVATLYLLGDYVIRFVFVTEKYNDTVRQLPIKIQFPFDIQQSPIFEFTAVTVFIHTMLQLWTIAIVNGLIFTLVLHVSGQIDIICEEFKNISKNILFYGSSVPFGMLIERHNKVISFSDNIEQLFSFIALMQVVWNTLVICCLGFVFIISIYNGAGVFMLMKTVLAYLAITTEAFLICFVGEYLSHKGKLITSATYETLWYNMSSNQCKIIMLIMMRSQKRLAITAGNMLYMSFETFTSIMKASASYVSVLIAMY
ncbi:LOW QUALITY PROTEIN: odorant receptor 22c [Monomorium pharaonis]|uniref:LOW QUALITY PROTEIN: odorant receptor 22c n=1 Tax=Monomorium pharaonis TaxID=307658 RepID=UPI001746C202|nr:LOW QUALITY PROTEIN: odorant receptor 22c [Monomorium pharaonis]